MTLPFFNEKKLRWLLLGFLCLFILVFSKTIFFGFVWDDNYFLVEQVSYQTINLKKLLFTSINGVEYFPLRDLTYMVDYKIWGWNPLGFHLTNLILYFLNIWAVYGFTRMLNSTLFPSGNWKNSVDSDWVAFFTAALFAVLPLHSEAVAFIHSRNVLLSGLFFFLSCTYYLKYINTKLWHNVAIAFVFFFFALLSKATVIMLPLILLVFLYFRSGKRSGKWAASVIPFIVLAIIFFFLFRFYATESEFIKDGAILTFGSYNFLSRIAVALQIPYFYLVKLVLPVGLSTEYDIEFASQIISPISILALLMLCSLFASAYYFKDKFPQLLFALLWFLICLAPVSNFFLTNPVVADRYAYIPSYAFAYILVFVLYQIGEHTGLRSPLLLLIPILGIYSWLTFERNDVWRSEVTVMRDMTKSGSNQSKGFNNLGRFYFEEKQYSKAFEFFRNAKDVSSAESQLELYQANLAFQQNRPFEALKILKSISPFNENKAFALNLRGQIQESQGELIAAAKSYRESLSSSHAKPVTREYASTRLQHVMGLLEPTLDETRKYIHFNPDDLNRKAEFAVMLQNAGIINEAILLYKDLLKANGPKWQIYYNLGKLYKDDHQLDQSIRYFQLSLSLNSSSAMIHNELGILYKQIGQFDDALSHFQTAIKLDPGSAYAQVNLARLHFQLGNAEQARRAFNHVQASFPEYKELARGYLLKLER